MSDERLRALERAARADPSDLAAGRALAHALLQAGERRKAFYEYSRLARAGDGVAVRAVREWQPRAHMQPHGPKVSSSASALTGAVRRAEWRGRQPPYTTPLLVSDGERVVMIDVRHVRALGPDLRLAWEHPVRTATRAALRGDDVLHSDGLCLVAREGASGVELDRVELDLPTIVGVLVDGDRAFVMDHTSPGHASRVVALDVGDRFGHVLWSRTSQGSLTLAGPHLVVVEGDRIDLWRLDSGHDDGSRRILPRGRSRRSEVVDSIDERGIVTRESAWAPGDLATSVTEYALPTLEPRWRIESRSRFGGAFLLGDVALIHGSMRPGLPRPATLMVVDRTTGVVLAERVLEDFLHGECARAGDTIYAVTGQETPALLGLDARTLETVERVELGVTNVNHVFDLLVLDRAIVVAFEMRPPTPGTVIVRLDSE